MKRNISKIKSLMTFCIAAGLTTGMLLTMQSCTEKLDDSNFAIAKEQTIADYIADNPDLSKMCALLQRVPLGHKEDASSVFAALSARGNYTIFIPTNDAIDDYVAKVVGAGKTINDLDDEQAELVVYSCIIDNGSESAYDSATFPMDGSPFQKTDLNDRGIVCDTVSTGDEFNPLAYRINNACTVIETDVKLSNGYLHVLGDVIAPSNDYLPDLIKQADNMHIMGALLYYTGWDKYLTAYMDQDYENEEHLLEKPAAKGSLNRHKFYIPQHRYFRYTGLIETDDVFMNAGVPAPESYNLEDGGTLGNWNDVYEEIKKIAEAAYGADTTNGDLKNENNPVNRFVAYHFIDGLCDYGSFVNHMNEYGYGPGNWKTDKSSDYKIDIADYYTTVVPEGFERHGIIKVMQEAVSKEIYVNRVCKYKVAGNYEQISVEHHGVKISAQNKDVVTGEIYENNSKNGYYYPIDGILTLDPVTAKALGNERIRFDVVTILPELLNTGKRGDTYLYFDTNQFFDGITGCSDGTELRYLTVAEGETGWGDMEGDELMALGVYDFVLRLPTVPVDGTYEIRMGLNANNQRGMCQVYWGESDDNLVPVGLPLDLRLDGSNENIGWVQDVDGNDAQNAEVDKNMRNHGYMKAPYSIHTSSKTAPEGDDTVLRRTSRIYRRVMTTVLDMKAGKPYFMRFKSCLDDPNTEFVIDYFEYVPRSVYNGQEPEDKW